MQFKVVSRQGSFSCTSFHTLRNASTSACAEDCLRRFDTFAFDELVNSPKSLDLEKAINEGRLGDEASEAFGRLLVAAIQGLALRCAEQDRVPINLFIDECQNYIAPATMQILEEARKYGVSL